MKIKRLKRRADELAAEARSDRLESRSRAERALVIARRRVGSTTGLAVSFSLGFMAGTGKGSARTDKARRSRGDDASREGPGPTLMHRLAHGPVGEAGMKLGMALLARSLMKLQEEDGIAAPPPGVHTANISNGPGI